MKMNVDCRLEATWPVHDLPTMAELVGIAQEKFRGEHFTDLGLYRDGDRNCFVLRRSKDIDGGQDMSLDRLVRLIQEKAPGKNFFFLKLKDAHGPLLGVVEI